MLALINIERQANNDYYHDPSSKSLKRLREAKSIFEEKQGKAKTNTLIKASASIQAAADRSYTKLVYEGIKKAA